LEAWDMCGGVLQLLNQFLGGAESNGKMRLRDLLSPGGNKGSAPSEQKKRGGVVFGGGGVVLFLLVGLGGGCGGGGVGFFLLCCCWGRWGLVLGWGWSFCLFFWGGGGWGGLGGVGGGSRSGRHGETQQLSLSLLQAQKRRGFPREKNTYLKHHLREKRSV